MKVRSIYVAGATLGLTVLGTVLTSTANAATVFTANLTQDQEPPPAGTSPPLTSTGDPRPLSFGTATFVLNDAQTQLSMDATVFNIDVTGTQTPDTFDNLVAAHIHVYPFPPPSPLPPTAPVRWGFFGTPDNDNNPDQLVVTPFAAGLVGGTFSSIWDLPEGNAGTTLTTNLPGIFAGLSYINFHTVQFGGGEIRGQIVPGPIAGAGLPALLAFGGFMWARRRKAAAA